MKNIKKIPSPNFDERGSAIDTLVLHYTDMESAKPAIDQLINPDAKVSSHYVVDEDGTVISLVEEKHRAWHAGKSFWRGRDGVNDFSIGIEIVNPGHSCGYRPFPKIQMQAVAELCLDIVKRNKIEPRNIIAHSDIAPERKKDPGELFDWEFLAKNGIGLWHGIPYKKSIPIKIDAGNLQGQLAEYGYKISKTGEMDRQTKDVITAFQRHFLPLNDKKSRDFTGAWGDLEQKILETILEIAS